MRYYSDRLLSTVHWSLGVLVTVAAILVTFGWFVNFHLYDRDNESLSNELKAQVKLETTEAHARIDAAVATRLTAIEAKVETSVNSAIQRLDARLDTRFTTLERAMAKLEYDLKAESAERWCREGVGSNALRDYRQMLEIAMRIGWDFLIAQALDEMHRVLKLIAAGDFGRAPDAQDLGFLVSVLGKVPEKYSVVSDAIRELLTTLRSR